MTRQGYLIVYDKSSRPTVSYFSLEDGCLRQYATIECVKCLSEVHLSGCKIIATVQTRADGVPNSFYLETRKVFVKDRSYTLGSAERIEFSACSSADRQEWGKALFSWQRFYWRDPQVAALPEKSSVASETRLQLERLIAKHFVQKPSTGHSIAAAKQPISFLRRNTRLSLTTKPKNVAEPTDCVKDKVALAKVKCSESAKSNKTWQVSYFPARFSRSSSQKAH